jgi:hypothetical protein
MKSIQATRIFSRARESSASGEIERSIDDRIAAIESSHANITASIAISYILTIDE